MWITVVLLIIGLVLWVMPVVRHQWKRAIQTYAVSNARQLGFCLAEFETEYGKFPDATTIAAVQSKSGTLLPLGTKYSNDFFRQFIANGNAQSEGFFYAAISGSRKPDGDMDGSHALGKGECGYSYIIGARSKDGFARPSCFTPMIPETDRFDPTPFEGKAVVLRADNSVTSLAIDKQGHAIFDGKNLMDPAHPVWQDKPPTIAWPDL